MKGKVVSIRLSYSEIQSCVDVSELVMGRKTNLAHSIQTVVRIFLSKLQNEGKLPSYSDEEAMMLLEDSFGKMPGKTLEFNVELEPAGLVRNVIRNVASDMDLSPGAAGSVDEGATECDIGAGEDFSLPAPGFDFSPQAEVEDEEKLEKEIEEVKRGEEKDFLKRIMKEDI